MKITTRKQQIYSQKNKRSFEYDVIDKMPKGWKVLEGVRTNPKGYTRVWNGQSPFSNDRKYQSALIRTSKLGIVAG